MILQGHGQRIGLLSGRTGRAPDPQGARGGAALDQAGQHGLAQACRRDGCRERTRSRWWSSRPPRGRVSVSAAGWRSTSISAARSLRPMLAHHAGKARFQQICLVRRDDQTGALFSRRRDEGEIIAGHAAAPWKRLARCPAIMGRGRMAEQMPALATAPGHAPDHAGRFVLGDDRRAGRRHARARRCSRRCPCRSAPRRRHRRRKAGPRCGTGDRPTGGRNSPARSGRGARPGDRPGARSAR